MKTTHALAMLALSLTLGSTGTALAGAPQPEQRQGDFAHVCEGGPNRGLSCTVPTQEVDCPGSDCIVQASRASARGTLTLIAHDSVTDWANGGATNRALTVLLEVRAPSGTQLLAATYQHLADPTLAPTAPGNIVAIEMDEQAVRTLAGAVNGIAFVQPESTLAAELQTLFGSTGTPAIVAATQRGVQTTDHTAGGLATVLRFKVKIQFLTPIP